MIYTPGQAYYKEFTTSNPTTGAAANADALPAATANRNGADDAAFVLTVANLDTGRYKITGTVPAGYVEGDVVNVTVAATVGGVAAKGHVDTCLILAKLPTDAVNAADAAKVSADGAARPGDEMVLAAAYDAQLTAIANYVDTLETTLANAMVTLNKLQFDADEHLQADATISAADIAAVADGVKAAIPAAVIPVLQGSAFRDVAPTTTIVQVRRGETISIPYDLGADYVGYTPWFGARLGIDSATYAIAPRAVRKVTNRTGFIDLVPSDLAAQGNLSGELEIRKDSDPTQVLKPCSFMLQVKKAVIR